MRNTRDGNWGSKSLGIFFFFFFAGNDRERIILCGKTVLCLILPLLINTDKWGAEERKNWDHIIGDIAINTPNKSMQREGLSPTALLIWGTEVRRAPTKRNFSCFLTLLSHLFISYTKVFPHIPTFPSEMSKGGCGLGAWRMHEVLQTRLKVLLTLLLLLLLLSRISRVRLCATP